MHAGRQERRRVRVSKIVEPQTRKPDTAHQAVPVTRERVRGERFSVTALYDEVEVGPRLPEQKPSPQRLVFLAADQELGEGPGLAALGALEVGGSMRPRSSSSWLA